MAAISASSARRCCAMSAAVPALSTGLCCMTAPFPEWSGWMPSPETAAAAAASCTARTLCSWLWLTEDITVAGSSTMGCAGMLMGPGAAACFLRPLFADEWESFAAFTAAALRSASTLASTSKRARTAAAADAGGTLRWIFGASRFSAATVWDDSSDRPAGSFLDVLASPASCCKLSSIPTYCNPFCRKLTKAPGGIDFSAFRMLDLPSMLS
mmetsp:Transcript_10644/g.30404  ORF Transcript_10644/g.30404 Transcript_10644/m.30404 type:complete len:212 (+) Transcript_10644:134-769(+)